jgi:histidinol-phosphate/aromatic aminotransferase/cobyric acid decarboxylase-like protein
MGKRYFKESTYIDDDILITQDDVVVMSVPFSDTGSVPKNYTKIMEACESLKVPVLLDMAYINLAIDLQINVDYQCIDTITTSLSKVFPVAYSRIGMRMQRENLDDTLDAYEQNSYLNTHSVNIGHALIKKYEADYSYHKYREQQLSFCNMLDLTPSDSFIFGIDYKNKSQEYNRGGPSNRFCFSKHFQ